jgi:hypothetical protein
MMSEAVVTPQNLSIKVSDCQYTYDNGFYSFIGESQGGNQMWVTEDKVGVPNMYFSLCKSLSALGENEDVTCVAQNGELFATLDNSDCTGYSTTQQKSMSESSYESTEIETTFAINYTNSDVDPNLMFKLGM